MEGKQVSAEELKGVWAADFDQLAQKVAKAMNGAADGHVISDTEEPVRQANAVFRERLCKKAIRLLQTRDALGQIQRRSHDGLGQPLPQRPMGTYWQSERAAA